MLRGAYLASVGTYNCDGRAQRDVAQYRRRKVFMPVGLFKSIIGTWVMIDFSLCAEPYKYKIEPYQLQRIFLTLNWRSKKIEINKKADHK